MSTPSEKESVIIKLDDDNDDDSSRIRKEKVSSHGNISNTKIDDSDVKHDTSNTSIEQKVVIKEDDKSSTISTKQKNEDRCIEDEESSTNASGKERITITPATTRKNTTDDNDDQLTSIKKVVIEDDLHDDIRTIKPEDDKLEDQLKQMETPKQPSSSSSTKPSETPGQHFITPSTTSASTIKKISTSGTIDVSFSTISTQPTTCETTKTVIAVTGISNIDRSFDSTSVASMDNPALSTPSSSTRASASTQNTPLSYYNPQHHQQGSTASSPYVLPNMPSVQHAHAPHPYHQFYHPHTPAPPVTLFPTTPSSSTTTSQKQTSSELTSTQKRKKRKVMPDLTKYYVDGTEVTTRSEHEELDLRRLSSQEMLAPDSLLMLGPRSSVTAITEEELLENRDRNKLKTDHEEEIE